MPDGFDYQAFLSLDSTNKEAVRQAHMGAKSGFWISSIEQTEGRGRRGRKWASVSGNLYCSLIYDSQSEIYKASQLSFVTTLAVCDTVAECLEGVDVKCKWPNDVLVDNKKISGILLETFSKTPKDPIFMIIGIGINIQDHPKLTLYEATHINEHTKTDFNADDIFSILTQKMAYWLEIWNVQGFATIREQWLKHCKGLGENICVRMPNEELMGRFVDLDSNGALRLAIGDEIRLIHSGDVFFDTTKNNKRK